MIIAKCLTCNKLFETYKSFDRKYCSEDCWIVSMANNDHAKRKGMFKTTCLGINCRGRKTFMTSSKYIRLCPICKQAIKTQQEDKY
jgi:endogenous inhibitor of DNA gyrase (YacG/DUF329 family)